MPDSERSADSWGIDADSDRNWGVVMMETHKRSILKAVGYKAMSIVVLAVTSYVVTGDWESMSWITGVYTLVAITGYYVWERLWGYIRWGRKE